MHTLKPQKKTPESSTPILCIIAGGSGSRMGNKIKCMLKLGDEILLERLATELSNQFLKLYPNAPPRILLNINHITDEVLTLSKKLNLEIVPDNTAYADNGPLSGVASCLSFIQKQRLTNQTLVTVSGDSVIVAASLLKRLTHDKEQHHRLKSSGVTYCSSRVSDAYTTACWNVNALPSIENFLLKGQRAVKIWHQQNNSIKATFPCVKLSSTHNGVTEIDPFYNINTPKEYEFAKWYIKNCTKK